MCRVSVSVGSSAIDLQQALFDILTLPDRLVTARDVDVDVFNTYIAASLFPHTR